MTMTFRKLSEIVDSEREEKYPLLENKKKGYMLKNSYTNGRVTYIGNYFYLWVYPNTKEAINAYDFECRSFSELCSKWIPHLLEKSWFSKRMAIEVIDLGREMFDDGVRL